MPDIPRSGRRRKCGVTQNPRDRVRLIRHQKIPNERVIRVTCH
jgi:hypothetical protein